MNRPQPSSTELIGGWEGVAIAVLRQAIRDRDFDWLSSDGPDVFLEFIGTDKRKFMGKLLADAHHRRTVRR